MQFIIYSTIRTFQKAPIAQLDHKGPTFWDCRFLFETQDKSRCSAAASRRMKLWQFWWQFTVVKQQKVTWKILGVRTGNSNDLTKSAFSIIILQIFNFYMQIASLCPWYLFSPRSLRPHLFHRSLVVSARIEKIEHNQLRLYIRINKKYLIIPKAIRLL